MNTPKTRKPVRWKPSTTHYPPPEAGGYWGIADTMVAAEFGFLVSYWWHVEETMTFVFEDLLEGRKNDTFSSNSAARRIFRTIISEDARIKLMTALLEGSPHNTGMSEVYDTILDEFKSLNSIRNDLVHGRWFTDAKTMVVTVRKSSNIPIESQRPQTITAAYLQSIVSRMRALHSEATLRGGEPLSSRGTPLPPRD
ncbi:MAG: hypothetical protein ABR588_06020 [Sphingomicrobium sp.]